MSYYPAGVTAAMIDERGTPRPRPYWCVRAKGEFFKTYPYPEARKFFYFSEAVSAARQLGGEVVHHEIKKGWITDWKPEATL